MKKQKNPNKKLSTPNTQQNQINDHFQDEDYIVFCFTQDGAFDIVQETPSSIKTKGEETRIGEDGNGKNYQNHETICVESMESNQSGSSSSTESFSFPVFEWELRSPDLMPKSQGRDAGKHKLSYARFQCCRF